MVLMVSVDAKKNERMVKSVAKICDRVKGLIIVDEKLMELVADIAMRKGWLGERFTVDLANLLVKEYTRMAERWVENMRKGFGKHGMVFEGKIRKGNFVEVLVDEAKALKVSRVVLTYKKGFNPYWSVIKELVPTIRRKLEDIELMILA